MSIVLQGSTNFTRTIADGQLTTTEVDSSKLFSKITRSKRTQALTYFLFAVNWLLALCSIIITALSFGWKGKARYSLALAPLILILAIPTIRGLYPGDPALGVVIGTHCNYVAPRPGLTLPARPGGLLSSNAIRGILRCGYVGRFCSTAQQQGSEICHRSGRPSNGCSVRAHRCTTISTCLPLR